MEKGHTGTGAPQSNYGCREVCDVAGISLKRLPDISPRVCILSSTQGSKCSIKGLQTADQSRLERGYRKRLIALSNPLIWSKGKWSGDFNGNTFKFL